MQRIIQYYNEMKQKNARKQETLYKWTEYPGDTAQILCEIIHFKSSSKLLFHQILQMSSKDF